MCYLYRNVFKVEPIYVTGYVRDPRRTTGSWTVKSLAGGCALSGGFEAASDREEVIIHRTDGTTVEVPFRSEPVDGVPQQVLLYPGDILDGKKEGFR